MDFEDPYGCCWIGLQYINNLEIDNKEYGVYACYTDFSRFSTFDNDNHFKFFMLMHRENADDHTVGAYMKSEHLYVVDEEFFEDDFPEWVG